jgi:hypothetical protein
LERLAGAWGKAPWELEDDPRAMKWIARKLELTRIEHSLNAGNEG